MRENTIKKLNNLNKAFYTKTAVYFDSSRQYAWEGWDKFWDIAYKSNKQPRNVLDVGCGNGRFVSFLEEKLTEFKYIGIDNSSDLLKMAKERYKSPSLQFKYKELLSDWEIDQKFDLIVSFGVFHHIPGYQNRLKVLKSMKELLSPRGVIVIAFWDFLKSQRFKGKIQNWDLANIDSKEVDENDYLINWKRGTDALRYCHYYSQSEITQLTKDVGLDIKDEFLADGKTGDLNRYIVL